MLDVFHAPWYFWLLLLLPILAWRLFLTRRRTAVKFTGVSLAKHLTPSLRQRMLWLPKLLSLLTIFLLIVALARPRDGREQTIINSEGIAIQMVVDCSQSMQALDFKIDGERVDRLTAVKNVAKKFVLGGEQLDGRINDLVGLISFARFADGVTPLTLDHRSLVANLNQTEIVVSRQEGGTSIGDAIALAVEKLNALDQRQAEKIESKIVILLTDGENTTGNLEPITAAELAQSLGIKIYTIGVGTKGMATAPVQDVFGRTRQMQVKVSIDEDTLTKVAQATGGKYFRAVDTESLTKIYQEIDQLEKTKVETKNVVDYRELAVQSFRWNGIRIPPVLWLAMLCLIARVVLQHTWLPEIA